MGAISSTGGSVQFDHASLRSQAGVSHTRYSVTLSGSADAGWRDAYRAVCEESPNPRSFPLDLTLRSVSFTCANVEGPAMVIEMLERLEALLVLADRRREMWSAAPAAASPATPARSIA
jgi:hypothetical protein